MGDPQLIPCVKAAALASQPLPIEQMRSRQVHAEARRLKMIDRRTVERLGRSPVGEQRSRARFDAQSPRCAGGARGFAQQLEGLGGAVSFAAAAGGFDQLDERKGGEPQLARIRYGVGGSSECILVAGQPVVEHGRHPLGNGEPHPLAPGDEVLGASSDQWGELILAATKGRQRECSVQRDDSTMRRLRQDVGLLDERRRRLQLTGEQVDAHSGAQGEGKVPERADFRATRTWRAVNESQRS